MAETEITLRQKASSLRWLAKREVNPKRKEELLAKAAEYERAADEYRAKHGQE